MNRMLLLRHGECRTNLTKEFSCRRVDYPLTGKGVLQARQTARALAAEPVTAVFCSPLLRAVETAEVVAAVHGLPVHVVDEFRELDVGDLEGRTPTADLWEEFETVLDAWRGGNAHARFPGGEDQRELCERMGHGLRLALAGRRDETVIVVTHGGILTWTAPAWCPSADLESLLLRDQPNCAVTAVDFDVNGVGTIVRWASHGHLTGDAADLVPGTPQPGELPRRDAAP